MAAIFQTTFSNAFSWMKIDEFQLMFHWSLFLSVELTIFQHWFRRWLGTDQATSHYLNQWRWSFLTHICVTRPQWVNENSCLVYASHIPSRFVKYQITKGIILCLPHIAASHFKIHKRLSPRKAAYCGATRVIPHEHHGVSFQRPVDCWIDSSGWEQEQNNLPSKQCINGDCVGNISATGVKLQSRLKTDFAPCCALLW